MKNPYKIVKDCIENEEPVFVLRGKDIFAIKAIQAYYEAVKTVELLMISLMKFMRYVKILKRLPMNLM